MTARGTPVRKTGKSGFGHSKIRFRGNSLKDPTPTGRAPERTQTLTLRIPLYRQVFRGALQPGLSRGTTAFHLVAIAYWRNGVRRSARR
jgi:hypothetical protein